MKHLFHLTFMNMKLRKARTILTLLGITIGVVAVVSLLSLGIGVKNVFLREAGDTDSIRQIIVEAPDNNSRGSLKLTEHNIEKLRKTDKVAYVYPRYVVPCKLRYEKYEMNWEITGIPYEILSEMKLAYGSSDRLAKNKPDLFLGNSTGDFFINYQGNYSYSDMEKGLDELVDKKAEVTLYNISSMENEIDIDENNVRLRFAGVLDGEKDEYNDKSMGVYCDLDVLLRYLGIKNDKKLEYTSVMVVAKDVDSVDFIVKKLRDMGYQVTNNKELLDSAQKNIKVIRIMLGGIGMIAFIVALIGISNTMTTAVYDRIGEIGLLKVLGCDLREINIMFLMEAGIFGLTGGITGVLLSLGIKSFINKIAVTAFALAGGTSLVIITPELAIGAIVLSAFFGIAAGYIPAKWASGLNPLKE